MPSLSVRSFAEMLEKPAYEQIRILHEQKYPSKEPQMFKIPYYGKSLNAIRKFYKNGNDYKVIIDAIKDIELNTRPESKSMQNKRVLDSFSKSKISKRIFAVKPNSKFNYLERDVDLRLVFDLIVEEKKKIKYIFFNLRNAEITDELAKKTLEISYYIIKNSGIPIAGKELELIDLFSNKVHKISKTRARTINLMKSNMGIIDTLWPTI